MNRFVPLVVRIANPHYFVLLSGALLFLIGDRAVAQGKETKLPSALAVKPLQVEAGDDQLRKLQKERFNAALTETRGRYHEFRFSGMGMPLLLAAIQRLSEAECALHPGSAERIEIHKKFVDLLNQLKTHQEAQFKGGEISRAELALIHHAYFDAQIRLLEAQRDAKIHKGK